MFRRTPPVLRVVAAVRRAGTGRSRVAAHVDRGLVLVSSAEAASRKASPAAKRKAPPKLRVKGLTLRWNKVRGVARYRVMIRVPGHKARTVRVRKTSYTPPRVAGKTVAYRLRTHVKGSRWSRKVRIRYAASQGTPSPSPAPAAAPAPPRRGCGWGWSVTCAATARRNWIAWPRSA